MTDAASTPIWWAHEGMCLRSRNRGKPEKTPASRELDRRVRILATHGLVCSSLPWLISLERDGGHAILLSANAPAPQTGSNSTTKTRGVVHSLITKVFSRGLIVWPLIAVSASEICLNELVNGTAISSGTHYARISGSSQLSPPNISANALFPATVFPHISAATAFAVRIGGDI